MFFLLVTKCICQVFVETVPERALPQVVREAPDAARYYEESAAALAAAAAREGRAAPTARLLAPLFPGNAYLALGTRTHRDNDTTEHNSNTAQITSLMSFSILL